MSEYYITLLSHSDTNEFLQNKANSYKDRLANPLFLRGEGRKVGLPGISLPDSIVNLSSLTEGDPIPLNISCYE